MTMAGPGGRPSSRPVVTGGSVLPTSEQQPAGSGRVRRPGTAVASTVVSRRRRLLAVLLVVVAALVLSACRVSSEVAVRVERDGSGQVAVTVRLDPEAARRLGDPATALRTEDLVTAGWVVETPEVADDGAVVLRAERDFASPQELPMVLDEVGGTDGVFRDVSLSITDGFAATDYSFGAKVELNGGAEQFGDDALTAVLGGVTLARTPEELALEGGADPEAMTLRLSVELPGGAPETNGAVEDGAVEDGAAVDGAATADADGAAAEVAEVATWSFPVTGGEPTAASLSSTSTVDQTLPRVLVVVALLSLIAAVGLGAFALIRRRA